jgi:hydroxylamine reductase
MYPKDSYSDRVYTTSVVNYPKLEKIEANSLGYKHFEKIINHALILGGYPENKQFSGLNGGKKVTTGFGHHAILKKADIIIKAVKNGEIKHFYLVGGCDGHQKSRKYYTEFVKSLPKDTIVLTLACGKFRFNDLDCGKIGPFPRILDIGQCNDAFGAIHVVSTLASALKCTINELPLTLVLSWYEQKAICILLSLLSMGIKNINLGPTLPAFISPKVLNTLIEKFAISGLATTEDDLT